MNVLKEAGVQQTLMRRISQRQIDFLGHVMRRRHSLENSVVTETQREGE